MIFFSPRNKQVNNEMLLTDVVNGEENDFLFFIWENIKLFLFIYFFFFPSAKAAWSTTNAFKALALETTTLKVNKTRKLTRAPP